LTKILAEQPQNIVDTFEEYSKKLKEERFKIKTDHLRDLYIPPMQYNDAKKLIKLFQVQFDNVDNKTTIYSNLFQIKNMQIMANEANYNFCFTCLTFLNLLAIIVECKAD